MKIKTRRYYIYYIGRVIGFVIGLLPIRFGLLLAELAGGIGYALLIKERKRAIKNLHVSLPGKSDREIRSIARKVFSNLCKNAVEWINSYKLNKKNLHKWMTQEGFDKVNRAIKKRKGIIILASHFGNWELMSFYFALSGYPTNVIARRLYFEKYDRFISSLRRAKGVNIIYRDESPRKILKALRHNEVVGILADQDIDSVDGTFVKFFGRMAYTPKAPVMLALSTGAPLIPCFLIRKNGSHKLVVEDPIEIVVKSSKEETIKYNTQRWSMVVESYIRKYPDQWVWMHRRWKTKVESHKEYHSVNV